MNPWEQLLAVQAIDTRIDQLDHKMAGLPERAAVAAAEKAIGEHAGVVAEVESTHHGLEKERKRLEDEISLVEDKRTKTESTLYGGDQTDTKQLQALQDEMGALGRRISALEDEELEIMEQLEPVDARLADLATERATLDSTLETAMVALAEAEAALHADRDTALHERSEALDGIDAAVVETYETQRKRLGGVAVARLQGSVCGTCHMNLSAVEVDRIKHLPADAHVTCEDCGRSLVRS